MGSLFSLSLTTNYKIFKVKKVLVITYYWPVSGGPGVQRWVKFVKYLRKFNVEPIIYTPKNPNYPIIDTEIGKDLPQDILHWTIPILEPHTISKWLFRKKTQKISAGIIAQKKSILDKFLLWIRGNLFIPDTRKFWVNPSVKFLKERLLSEGITTIITTGPPHSLHLIGLKLKSQLPDLKWIADFRDPWVNIGYHKEMYLSEQALKKHILLENKVLQNADAIITTSFTTQKEFQEKTKTPVHLITNGYDSYPFEKQEISHKFLISHIGSLLSKRNPLILWEVLSEMTSEIPSFSRDLQLCFAGKVSLDVIELLAKMNLTPYLKELGYISHKEALMLQRKSQILLLLEINDTQNQGIIPGKLFEYMASERPIVAIGPQNWDAGKIIRSTNTGKVFEYNQKEKLKACITQYYNLYRQGELKIYPVGLAPFSRKNLTKRLSEIIHHLG